MVSTRWFAFIFICASFACVIGCNKDQSTPTPAPNANPRPNPAIEGEPTGPHAEGLKAFKRHCSNCHAFPGAISFGPKMRGPDLSKIAADPTHTEEWLREFILDPRAHMKPKMPSMQGKISDDEMKALLAYLVTLK